MKRKKYSNDNRLTVQLGDQQYKKVFAISQKLKCSKADVIRSLLTGSHVSQTTLNKNKQYDERLTDVLNKIYGNLYRIGGNFNQAVKNQNILFKKGEPHGLDKLINLIQLKKLVTKIKTLVYQDMNQPRRI